MNETANVPLNSSILGGSLSPFVCSNFTTFAERSDMAEGELNGILNNLDDALDVYRLNAGRLTALEIKIKSMLTVVRAQVAGQIVHGRAPAAGSESG